jgi:HD-GYP domain-containing protein (c-di-GMP phosphodiesterase class II)
MSSAPVQIFADNEGTALNTFEPFSVATDEFEDYKHPHASRIAVVADELAKLFHLGRQDRLSLRVAAYAHDLGELVMERDYIRRAGSLSQDERLDLARHPLIGEQEAARAGADRGAQLIIRWHHEWWIGTGYPDGLSFESIPLAARILRVADAYCSLTDKRPFREAYTEARARLHLTEWAGLEFDPHVVQAFFALGPLKELTSYAPAPNEVAEEKLEESLAKAWQQNTEG